MNTPICDFVNNYIKENNTRFHMPGHKGFSYLGCEPRDITEIVGADSLYEADGIIKESEQNAGKLFDSRTFYSTEGSSHVIRAMLHLACLYAAGKGKVPLIWAGRNAHSAFLSAAALLDLSVEWLFAEEESTYLSCRVTAEELDKKLKDSTKLPVAVYLTSPDYLGNQVDIKAIAEVCHRYDVLLLVDNAHGAYLKFLACSMHPMDLEADMCCDSSHKTLPVLTGGAYLHISQNAPYFSDKEVREAFRLFGSTSPSYLILQSLDRANRYMAEEFAKQLEEFIPFVDSVKQRLAMHGYELIGTEPLKLTLATKPYGYKGMEMAELLAKKKMVVEFADSDYVVFMLTPAMGKESLRHLTETLIELARKKCVEEEVPRFFQPQVRMTIRQATMSPFENLPIEQCIGRTLARASVGCPPAVPILVSGEIIDENAIKCFRYYGIEFCNVVKE